MAGGALAGGEKKVAAGAHLLLIDESGLMLAPLVRRTLAPRGQTPDLKQKASHRDRVSVVAGLSLSPPKRRRPGLFFQTHPKGYINNVKSVEFLREALRHLRGPVVVLWDNGRMHHGEPIRDLLARFPRLSIEYLPPYAPDLNAVEQLWTLLKYGRLSNYAAPDVWTRRSASADSVS